MIPVNEPLIGEEEKKYVRECLETGWISSGGRFIAEFEEGFAGYCSRKFGIAVNNGTNALIAALRALELPQGSQIILPTFTIISCALACIYNNLTPVFVDSDPQTWNIDTNRIEEKINSRTRAIMVVHIFGHPVKMDSIIKIAQKYNLKLIEDFAQAIGSRYGETPCGSFGDISCASFYANKTITTGEGGMCLTDSFELAEKLKSVRNLCFLPHKRFVHEELGYNFRMTNIQAAIGLGQLERIQKQVEKKRKIAGIYKMLLKELEEENILRLPVEKSWAKSIYWMYGILLEKRLGYKAFKIQEKLAKRGIGTRPFFYPLHLQPVFKSLPFYREERLEIAEYLYDYGFYLPSGLNLQQKDIKTVADTLKEILNGL